MRWTDSSCITCTQARCIHICSNCPLPPAQPLQQRSPQLVNLPSCSRALNLNRTKRQDGPPAQPLQQCGAQLQQAVLGHHSQQGLVIQVAAGQDLNVMMQAGQQSELEPAYETMQRRAPALHCPRCRLAEDLQNEGRFHVGLARAYKHADKLQTFNAHCQGRRHPLLFPFKPRLAQPRTTHQLFQLAVFLWQRLRWRPLPCPCRRCLPCPCRCCAAFCCCAACCGAAPGCAAQDSLQVNLGELLLIDCRVCCTRGQRCLEVCACKTRRARSSASACLRACDQMLRLCAACAV